MGLLSKIQARIELYRLENRYTRHRSKRSTFVSNSLYIDGEYVPKPTPVTTAASSPTNTHLPARSASKSQPQRPTLGPPNRAGHNQARRSDRPSSQSAAKNPPLPCRSATVAVSSLASPRLPPDQHNRPGDITCRKPAKPSTGGGTAAQASRPVPARYAAGSRHSTDLALARRSDVDFYKPRPVESVPSTESTSRLPAGTKSQSASSTSRNPFLTASSPSTAHGRRAMNRLSLPSRSIAPTETTATTTIGFPDPTPCLQEPPSLLLSLSSSSSSSLASRPPASPFPGSDGRSPITPTFATFDHAHHHHPVRVVSVSDPDLLGLFSAPSPSPSPSGGFGPVKRQSAMVTGASSTTTNPFLGPSGTDSWRPTGMKDAHHPHIPLIQWESNPFFQHARLDGS